MASTVFEFTIASCAQACSRLFRLLSEQASSDKWEFPRELPKKIFIEEARRYELWAENIAAFHNARLPSSLEYRIRNDESALRIVRKTLMYLQESLDMSTLCQRMGE
jgi:hypothetical protein